MSKQEKKIRILGRIVDRLTKTGVAGLRVEAWDKDLIYNDLVGASVTDDQGTFKIEFGAKHFQEVFENRKPNLFFKVFHNGDQIQSTEDSVLWNAESATSEILIEVERQREERGTEPRQVKGFVRLADGFPASGLLVSAFDRDLRDEQELGRTQTDKQGAYQIEYSTPQYQNSETGSADLLVRAFGAGGALLAASPILFNAPTVAEIDLTIPTATQAPPSLFEKILLAIRPVLRGLKVEELEEDKDHEDVSFLSGETGFGLTDVARLVLGHKLAKDILPPQFWFVLLGGNFYQFNATKSLKDQLNAILESLPSLDEGAVHKALLRGFNQNEISESFRKNVEEWIDAFLQFAARRLVSRDSTSFVKFALDDAGITTAKKQDKFARLFVEQKAFTPQLVAALEKDSSFKPQEIASLRTMFQLADITQGDSSVIKAIKEEFGVRQPENVRTLAKKSEREWVELIKRKEASGEIKLPIEARGVEGVGKPPDAEVYGRTLERQFREAFPTAAFTGGLERALGNGGSRGLKNARQLETFLNRHLNFELLNTSVDEFLRQNDSDAANDENFRLEVKAVQRVFKLAPTFEATDALLADNLHSAQQVYRIGKSEFVRRYGNSPAFNSESAATAWNRAADTHAAVVTVVADLKALEGNGLPEVLKNNNEALKQFPNWDNLFSAGDLCECEHCRSVLSPAAYFADLLVFLRDRRAANPAFSVKDILFARRPDLGYLELNCENALTPIPYVDVVCEVLEHVIANGENDVELIGLTTIPDNTPPTKTIVANALAAADLPLSSIFSLSQVDPLNADLWVVHGDDVTYLLKKKATPNFFAEVLRNTKTNADELRAYPQYVNPKAYDKLRQARYPSALPFDLFADEVRAAMKKTNLQRWDLMRTFSGPVAPNNPTEGEIAAEYFGISTDSTATFDENRLILVADASVVGQQAVWGEPGNAGWLGVISNVKTFLERTKLDYNQLLALIDLKFINPIGDIAITHLDPSCDTEQKLIGPLDATKLDRIHRFLRLWRKLNGWQMWEVDLVIRHTQIGNSSLDEAFLINLFYFEQLRSRLGKKTTVEQLCALFGNLNSETRFTKLHEKRADALYQNLFLNRRLVQPLDHAFDVVEVDVPGPTVEKLPGHHAVILAALGVREPDLILLEGLTKASDGLPYITDDLTLTNLSFLWRHSWLPKQLKLKIDEWKTLLKLLQQDVLSFGDPKAAWEFVQTVDQIKAAGFKPDELNWLLAADRTARAAVKEVDAARFLAGLRKVLQQIQSENDPTQYDFLIAVPPTDEVQLTGLLSSLLQKLNRNEADVLFFLAVLRGGVAITTGVQGLPVAFTFPAAITGAPNHISISYDEPNLSLRFTGMMTSVQRTILLTDPALAGVTANPAYQDAIDQLFQLSQSAVSVFAPIEIDVALPGITIPADRPSLPIRYNAATQKLSFTGVMTAAERTALIAAGNPAAAIDELFQIPRLAVKFFGPVFTSPLADLPPAINFKDQLPTELAAKIDYDAEERLLRFTGIMRQDERAALDALVPNVQPIEIAYHNAIADLAAQPQAIAPPDERIWMTETDLDATVPANDTLAKRLANAATKALAYLSKSLSANAVVEQTGAALGISEALTREVLSSYAILPIPPNTNVLDYLQGDFAATTGAVDYTTLPHAFNGWFWTNRVATLLKKWKLTLEEFERLVGLTTNAQLLDFLTLPLVDTDPVASIDIFLRTARLLRLRDTLPETGVTFLEVLEKLDGGIYATAADFAVDVALLNEAWAPADTLALTNSLDLAYPADYLLAENWERLRRAFYFLENLNAGTDTVKMFAAAAMNQQHAKTLKELLRAKFGTETWLTLSAEIQDVLRERKRDSLSAYLLTQPMPADAPTNKWENTNDLYAYYLLDVEMCSCMITSRLVQGSGSIQLFVQRCFMGLEDAVEVKADGDDGDSAWRWWKWMRKYRVWEANRKVFLWPENWIEPELRKDKSQFFSDLENELLQNEINQYNVETSLTNYLTKLDNVAQLEVVAFFHEDDADQTIIHVFGRTRGLEPHFYYYRRYDYRQWTPWEKIDLEIDSDYLIPVVVAKRLFLFWPVFKEVPDEAANSTVSTPDLNQPNAPVPKTFKKLQLRMAVSDYRQGKWTPKKVSTQFQESANYSVEIVKKQYNFYPIDRSEIDRRFGIKFEGHSIGTDGQPKAGLFGAFEIAGCKGVPEISGLPGYFKPAIRPEYLAVGDETVFHKWAEIGPWDKRGDDPENDFTLEIFGSSRGRVPVLIETPDLFKMTPPWHLSYFDRLLMSGFEGLGLGNNDAFYLPTGTWLPFFYNDMKRTFFVLPSLKFPRDRRQNNGDGLRFYYPEIKKVIRMWEDYFEGQIQSWLDTIDLSALPPAQRQALEQFLKAQLNEDVFPPYTDDQIKEFMKRYLMRFYHYYLGAIALNLFRLRQFHFKNFYHPFVCNFSKLVYNPLEGIPVMMSRETQLQDSGFKFKQNYQPTFWVVDPPTDKFYPKEVVDFSPDGSYSSYNWELFFHVPLMIANALSRNQLFEEARDWYHYIFNPIGVDSGTPGGSVMSRYWITKPFFETTDPQYIQQRIENIMRMIAGDTSVPGFSAQAKKDLEDQVLDWRRNPFEPHRIANYRTVAYQKTAVMKYLDNLISWGDYLFRQDSMESINEATQLYVLAAEILGPRPMKIPPQAKPPLESYNELEKEFDKFSNALVEVENLIPPMPGDDPDGGDPVPLPMLYFCIPHNEKLLGYWDTIADRLYKIRHCMNIEGVVRQLSLFEPPIDPAALVKAVAGGIDIGTALADLSAPLPLYRFNVLLQKANEVCNDVKSLGSALLSALEKKDAEALAQLRQSHEVKLLQAVKAVKQKLIDEAKANLEGIRRSKAVVEVRRDYYRDIEKIINNEQLQLDALTESQTLAEAAQAIKLAASIISYLPGINLGATGFGGSPVATFKIGGLELGQAANLASEALLFHSQIAANSSARASIKGGFDRRWDDWKLQERLAEKELAQMEQQIATAEVRIALAEKELENHELQMEQASETDSFMRSKYTNKDLYQWQIGQISGVYFQSYRLAYDLAKRAERCFRFELGLQNSSFINFGYWDSLKKGLHSGDKLQYDLRRLETAYLEQNRREFELTKHVSLSQLDPLALVKLRETGRCFFRLPEEIFDLDYPGHYFRRMKSVSITLPCIVGPYTTVSCTLRLLKNSIRINTANGDNGYAHNTDDQGLPADDTRFVENNIPVKAIAASGANNDSGVFELNFKDERYLPFEGAGAISEWSLELFSDLPANNPDPGNPDFGKSLRQFDYSTISDAIVHVKYTAREDAGPFKNGAVTHLREYYSEDGALPSMRLFNLRQEFPSQWHNFLHPVNPADGNVLEFAIPASFFPIKDAGKTIKINRVWLLARCTDAGTYNAVLTPPLPPPPPAGVNTMALARATQYGGLHFAQKDVSVMGVEIVPFDPPLMWEISMTRPGGGNLQVDPVTNAMEVQDLLLVVGYEWEE